MSTAEQIKSAIENLKEDEFLRLAKWLEAKVADAWHRLDSSADPIDFHRSVGTITPDETQGFKETGPAKRRPRHPL